MSQKYKFPEWARNQVVYEVNLRQYTPGGTISEFRQHLPRLKELGAGILWFMPLQPIGIKNRKGSLGSYYSIRNYCALDASYGTMDEFIELVNEIHAMGMYVILDWVANHTAWDSNLVTQHPEWYIRDWKGDFCPTPWWDWDDIIDLDYDLPEVRHYMAEAMKYWVREVDIDGYRCDVAGFVPTEFWNNVRRELDAIKPIFMLAEWENRDLHAEAFDMTYAWSWNDMLHKITQGQADVTLLFVYYAWHEKAFPSAKTTGGINRRASCGQ